MRYLTLAEVLDLHRWAKTVRVGCPATNVNQELRRSLEASFIDRLLQAQPHAPEERSEPQWCRREAGRVK